VSPRPLALALLVAAPAAAAQQPKLPRRYTAPYVVTPPLIDGRRGGDAAWDGAAWSEPFVDIEGDRRPAPAFLTRVMMAWDSTALYVYADMEEPHLWGTITQRDAVIFHDNDFEVFLDPDGDGRTYFELEINALGTVWDLFLPLAYRHGGRARDAWDITGLRSAVGLHGTLNHPADRDTGWSVELAIPWADLRQPEVTTPVPRAGDVWRVNFSRVQWRLTVLDGRYHKIADPATGRPLAEMNWVWSPQDTINMHIPERWGFLAFGRAARR
jgi:hypothetical protein